MGKNYHKSFKGAGLGFSQEAKFRRFQRGIADMIKKDGRAILAILPEGTSYEVASKDERNNPAEFTYTVGNHLNETPVPELLTFYPSNPTCRFLLNTLSDAFIAGEIDLKPGEAKEFTGFLGAEGEVPVRLRYLTEVEQAFSNTKFTIQLPAEVPVVLVEPPTPAGFFADSEGAPENFADYYASKDLRITAEMIAASSTAD
jgi:hypothetical protein